MTFPTNSLRLGLAAAIVVGSALPAAAVSAVATDPLNVRTCGSTECRIVDVLERGEEVDVQFCEGVWCAIARRGADGWVNANYLARGYDDLDEEDFYDDGFDQGYYDDDYYDDGFYIEPPRRRLPRRLHRRYEPFLGACIGGPNARFCVYD